MPPCAPPPPLFGPKACPGSMPLGHMPPTLKSTGGSYVITLNKYNI